MSKPAVWLTVADEATAAGGRAFTATPRGLDWLSTAPTTAWGLQDSLKRCQRDVSGTPQHFRNPETVGALGRQQSRNRLFDVIVDEAELHAPVPLPRE
ncbi:MAG: hypothetical protein IMY75_04695 [Chloroflexi bacterium]|nr:hypothetical protein [Chloroflexota bacterium]